MAPAQYLIHAITASVDVELPLVQSVAVDVDLALGNATAASPDNDDGAFHPSLSQVAADLSLPRMRWPAGSRSGYHGLSDSNWMRENRVGFGETTMPGR